MYGGEERFIRVFGRETGKRPLARPRGIWGMILKWIFKALDGETWTFDLGQDRDWWWALVNDVMNFLFCKMWGVSCLAEDLLASQVGLCPMELVGWLVGCSGGSWLYMLLGMILQITERPPYSDSPNSQILYMTVSIPVLAANQH
jgi:hypothetical protein